MTTQTLFAPTRAFPLSPSLLKAVGWSTLAVGLLDATDGVAFFGLTAGLNPIQVLQFIASGALGTAAYSGGLASAAAGLGLHFFIAAVVAGVFTLLYQALPSVRRAWWAFGLVYGAAVWLVMNLLVVPHSAIGPSPLSTLAVVHGVVGHALFVGLAAAWTLHYLGAQSQAGRV